MTVRQRKFLATVVMIVFVLFYALVVMALAQPILTGASAATQLAFYVVAGLAWVLPIIPLIRWMERPVGPRA